MDKAPTGLEGLDAITAGGLPRGRLTLLIGAPGVGKTVLGLQTLVNGALMWREPAIFVAFEERPDQVRAESAAFGWDLRSLEREYLFFLDAHLPADAIVTGGFDLRALVAALTVQAQRMGARRIVFDGVEVLLSLLDSTAEVQQEILRLWEWAAGSDLVAIVTAYSEPLADVERWCPSLMRVAADTVLELTEEVGIGRAQRYVRVAKYRGSDHARGKFPFHIGARGIEVPPPGQARPPSDGEQVGDGDEARTLLTRIDSEYSALLRMEASYEERVRELEAERDRRREALERLRRDREVIARYASRPAVGETGGTPPRSRRPRRRDIRRVWRERRNGI